MDVNLIRQMIVYAGYVILGIGLCKVFNDIIVPWYINKKTIEIEKNPKWIISEAKDYYGFSDIDFIIVDSKLGAIPRFRTSKDNTRLQLLLSPNTSVRDVHGILKLALIGKLKGRYNLWFPDKSLYWLSNLCYVLENDRNLSTTLIYEKKIDKKSVDLK